MMDQSGTIRLQVATALACTLALVFIIAAVSFFSIMELTRTIEEAMEESTHEARPLLELLQAVQQSDLEGHDYLTYGTRLELAEYKASVEKTDNTFEAVIKAPFADQKEKEWVRQAFIKWRISSNLTLSYATDDDPASKLKNMRKIDTLMSEVEKPLSLAFKRAQEEMHELKEKALALKNMFNGFLLLSNILAITGIILLWRWLVQSITAPLKELTINVRSVGTGETVIETQSTGDDELGRLIRAINDMSARVSESTSNLKELTEHDELTGLYNSRALMRLLNDEIARSRRYGHTFSFIILDVDHFKNINDTYGHVAGDETLRQLAALITDSIREVDRAARYGGDEIAIILPVTEDTMALSIAERIRLSVSSQHVMLPGGEMVKIEISIGMAEYPGQKESAKDLISAADDALYEAKRKGRNRVCTEKTSR